MHERFTQLIAARGYAIVFLTVGIESFGIPLPGETALTTFDVSLANWLHAHAMPRGYAVFAIISDAGSPVALSVVGIVVAIVLVVKQRGLVLAGWLAAFLGAGVLNWGLKSAIQRPRPAYGAPFLYDQSFSFPSGHAMRSLVTYGMLVYALDALSPTLRRSRGLAAATAIVVVVAIGFSRLHLGVHYCCDVVGGYAAGIVWLAACVSGVEVAERQRAPAGGERQQLP